MRVKIGLFRVRVRHYLSGSSKIVSLEARDIRFPTSRWLDGSDAMHTDPDYSAAYVVLRTDADDGVEGHGLTFTTGRGTEVCVAAIRALEPMVVGRTLESISADMRGFWRSLASDTQLRWLGPEKGVIHLATAAVVNAVWDLSAKRAGQAALEAPRGHDAGGARQLRRLPLHRGRPRRPRKPSTSSATRGGVRRRVSARSSPRATRRTRRRPAGSATATTRWSRSSARHSRPASRT